MCRKLRAAGFAVEGNVPKAQSGADLMHPAQQGGLQGLRLEAVKETLEAISTAIERGSAKGG